MMIALMVVALVEGVVLMNLFDLSIPCTSYPLILYLFYPLVGCKKNEEKECSSALEEMPIPTFTPGYSKVNKSYGFSVPDSNNSNLSFLEDEKTEEKSSVVFSSEWDDVSRGHTDAEEGKIIFSNPGNEEFHDSIYVIFDAYEDGKPLKLRAPCIWGCYSARHSNLFWGVSLQHHVIPPGSPVPFDPLFSQQIVLNSLMLLKSVGIDHSEISEIVKGGLRNLILSLA